MSALKVKQEKEVELKNLEEYWKQRLHKQQVGVEKGKKKLGKWEEKVGKMGKKGREKGEINLWEEKRGKWKKNTRKRNIDKKSLIVLWFTEKVQSFLFVNIAFS